MRLDEQEAEATVVLDVAVFLLYYELGQGVDDIPLCCGICVEADLDGDTDSRGPPSSTSLRISSMAHARTVCPLG